MASRKNITSNAATAPTAPVLRLVPKSAPRINRQGVEVAEALMLLAKEAIAGRLSGVCYVAMRPGQGYITDAVGECSTNPTFSRGMVRALDDKLASMVAQ